MAGYRKSEYPYSETYVNKSCDTMAYFVGSHHLRGKAGTIRFYSMNVVDRIPGTGNPPEN